MIDSLTSHNHRDFNARYRGSWGFYISPQEHKRILVCVTGADERRVSFVDTKGNPYMGYADKGMEFDFIPVDKGYFNGRNGIIWMERIPARQWSRGIHQNNTVVSYFNGSHAGLEQATLALILPEIYREDGKIGMGLSDAMAQYVAKKRSGVALSKHFAVCDGQCFFFKHTIGTITHGDWGSSTIVLDNDLVAQELRDIIRRNTLNISVEVKYG